MYILKCSNNTYYTGSTNDLDRRLLEHQTGIGANYTRKHRPVKLVYFEEFDRIDEAFKREKQVQNWSQKKKEALINQHTEKLIEYAKSHVSTSRLLDKLEDRRPKTEDRILKTVPS
ncbi:MAG: GIY-YIG nuclease family protein [Prolixibacteraceae bacterium]